MKCPCDVCEKAKDCPSYYLCSEMKEWLLKRKKSGTKITEDVFIVNEGERNDYNK